MQAASPDAPAGEALLRNGDRLDQKTFHALYEQTPEGFKAELVKGIVYVTASPTTFRHGRPHARLAFWLTTYVEETAGTDALDNTTNILGEESEPQPDLCLRVLPECGGQTTEDDKYIYGPSELVAEVAYSSVAIDLHAKKRDYEKAGVKEYLVVLADREEVVWFVRGRKGFSPLKPDADGVLRSRAFPGLWLDPAAVFAKTTRRLSTVLRQGLATDEHAAFVSTLEAARAAKAKR